LTDAEEENAKTSVWLDFSVDFNYLLKEKFEDFTGRNDEVGKLIAFMINNPDKFS